MIKYGLLACLMVSVAGISAMGVREDSQVLRYRELRELQQANRAAKKAFNEKYTSDEWHRDDNVKKEGDAIFNDGRALRTAIIRVRSDIINDIKLSITIQIYCQRYLEALEEKEDTERSTKVKPGSTKEDLQARIKDLKLEQDSLFTGGTRSNKERILDRLYKIEDELFDLNKQLKDLQ